MYGVVYSEKKGSLGTEMKRVPEWLPGYANKRYRVDPAKRQYERLVLSFNSDFCTAPNMHGVAKGTKSAQAKLLQLKAKLKTAVYVVARRTHQVFFPSFVPSYASRVTHDDFKTRLP